MPAKISPLQKLWFVFLGEIYCIPYYQITYTRVGSRKQPFFSTKPDYLGSEAFFAVKANNY